MNAKQTIGERSAFVREMDEAFNAFIAARTPTERWKGKERMAEVLRKHFTARSRKESAAVDRKVAASGKDE